MTALLRRVLLLAAAALASAGSGWALDAPHDATNLPNVCAECHVTHSSGSTFLTSDPQGIIDLCTASCHSLSGSVGRDVDPHTGPSVLTTAGAPIACNECHDPHSHDSAYPGSRCSGDDDGGGGCFIKDQISVNSAWVTPLTSSKTVVLTAQTGTNSLADGDTTYNGLCEVCHTATSYHRADGSGSSHNAGLDCIGCHSHSDGTDGATGDGFAGAGGCTICHELTQPNGTGDYRREVVGAGGDFTLTSHHVTDGTTTEVITDDDCEVCHDQSTHKTIGNTPNVLLTDADGGASITYDGTGSSVETFCLSCHDGDASVPFSDGATVADIEGTWAGSAHDATTAAGMADERCLGCHGGTDSTRTGLTYDQNVHGASYAHLLSRSPFASVAPTSSFLCYNSGCHGTSGSGGDLQTVFARTYTHTITSDTVHDEATEAASTWGSGAFTGGNRHVNCLDCHDSHAAGATNHTAGTNAVTTSSPIYGASGVSFTAGALAKWGTPTSANYTWTDSVTYEYEICLKCHSNYAWGSGSPPAGHTDVAKEFNPNSSTRHSVMGTPSGSTYGYFTGGWSTSKNMYCSDCHTSSTTTDQTGPHGSAVSDILVAPYTSTTGAAGTSSDLCFRCHTWASYGRGCSNTAASNANTGFYGGGKGSLHCYHVNKGAYNCQVCHGTIPHGWPNAYPVYTTSDTGYSTGIKLQASDMGKWGPTHGWAESDCSAAHSGAGC